MKKRIISAAVFVVLWVIILVVDNPIFDTAVVAIISAIAMYEFFKALFCTLLIFNLIQPVFSETITGNIEKTEKLFPKKNVLA